MKLVCLLLALILVFLLGTTALFQQILGKIHYTQPTADFGTRLTGFLTDLASEGFGKQSDLIGGTGSGIVNILACRVLGTPASHSIIGSLMILTPGIAFTMGIRDFVHGDYLSGTIRMIDALLIAASIAIGTGLVLSLYTFFTGVVVA